MEESKKRKKWLFTRSLTQNEPCLKFFHELTLLHGAGPHGAVVVLHGALPLGAVVISNVAGVYGAFGHGAVHLGLRNCLSPLSHSIPSSRRRPSPTATPRRHAPSCAPPPPPRPSPAATPPPAPLLPRHASPPPHLPLSSTGTAAPEPEPHAMEVG
jgi:hypothetical protein